MDEPIKIPDLKATTIQDTPNPLYQQEIMALKIEQLQHELMVARKRQAARDKYEPRLFWSAIGWMLVVLSLIIFQAYNICGFSLASGVMITIVGSTTINILGLLAIALKFIFPDSRNTL